MEEVKKEYSYTIGTKKYAQRPIVIGQVNQLIDLIKTADFPTEPTPTSILITLGDKVPLAVAIVLHDPDKTLREKDYKELAKEIEFYLTPEMALEVVSDFFDCNQISSLFDKIQKTVEKIGSKIKKEENGSKE